VIERDVSLADGRTLHVYDVPPLGGASGAPVVFWQHGTPNVGEPPAPLFAAAARLALRWVSHDRPGYGGSSPQPGRAIASTAADVAGIADALGIARFTVMGHSGGGSHALACAALLPERVTVAVSVSAIAPFDAAGLDWFEGMAPAAQSMLRSAVRGRDALAAHLASAEFDPEEFTPEDHAALRGPWGWLGSVAGKAVRGGGDGQLEDELAYVAPWGFDVARVRSPVLLVQGGADRICPAGHGQWLAERIRSAELWLRPDDGHISVLASAESALEWLRERVGGADRPSWGR
jgi:pimeloyl-ACP methyl ester carboxylesterase